MNTKFVTGFALAAALAAAVAPAVAQNVAIINGKAVPLERVQALSQQVARAGREITPEIEKQIKDEVITREIFMQQAQKLGLQTSPDFRVQMELARQAILIRELFATYQKTNPVTDDEIKAEYDKFAAANAGKEYRASHILVDSEAQAQAILAQLAKGGNFAEIAKSTSKDTGSGARGGDLDWAPASNYVPEFAQALMALEKGKLSAAPVKSQFGFHIIRLDDMREAQLPALQDLKPQIKQQLEQNKLAQYQQDLRAKARIE